MPKLIIAIVGGTILIAALIIFIPSLKPSTGGVIEINPQDFDAGDVSMAQGLVKKTYEVKNVGSGPLKISNIETSCDCTSATLRIGEKVSPKFSMPMGPGTNNAFWSEILQSGEMGELEVIFDPAFHGPHGTGPIVRGIYISTNDPKNKRFEIKLSANVLP
ncbi:MAG: DUF1573 domain-containing protein [Candidatus Wildermuthbacteria bacterium]|nr:DUF1573 domain-containing protein [Candidatus Wildermuthbacteria bacterium]